MLLKKGIYCRYPYKWVSNLFYLRLKVFIVDIHLLALVYCQFCSETDAVRGFQCSSMAVVFLNTVTARIKNNAQTK